MTRPSRFRFPGHRPQVLEQTETKEQTLKRSGWDRQECLPHKPEYTLFPGAKAMPTETNKNQHKVKRFFEKVNKKLRKNRFINRIVSPYEGVGKPGESRESVSPVLHPIEFYHQVNSTSVKDKGGSVAGKNQRNALGETVRM